ncbi:MULTISPECIES: hypothetical protein [unclassified Sphingomonas]|uniref:hypothetical protein n=1 Tax=unclassified Sphingomonas TaxID=196159 RepID=UPI0002881055|nr:MULTISPECIES: hypothetical protein [unclassified Sphingomonas]
MIRSTFALPVLIALATVFGLVVALTGDGMRDALSWIGLGCPIAAVGWAMARVPRAKRAPLRWASVATLVRD